MKIIIIGGGITGCATYLELRKHAPDLFTSDERHGIYIYEAYDSNPDVTAEQREHGSTHSATLRVGGGLGIAPNGLRVLERLEQQLLQDVTLGGYVVSHSNLKDKNGNLLMRMEPNGPKTWKDIGPAERMHSVATSRHSLWRCLRKRIPDEHIVRKRVLEVVASAEGRNLVRFVDGSESVEADLIIGADGVRSITRRALFPEIKEDPFPPHYEGLVGIGGFIPSADVKDVVEKGSMNFVFSGNGFFGYFFSDSSPSANHRNSPYYVSDPGESLAWWSTYEIKACPDWKTLDTKDVARQLQERHSQWKDPVVQRVTQSVSFCNMYPTWTSSPLPTWERDGVVLLGDAAHALPSTSGQGSSQALEDCEAFALFLSHHLQKVPDLGSELAATKQAITAAAKQYVALRQPHVKNILEAAKKMQNSKRSMGTIQELAMYSFMKFLGLFSNVIARQAFKVNEFNVAEDVKRVLSAQK